MNGRLIGHIPTDILKNSRQFALQFLLPLSLKIFAIKENLIDFMLKGAFYKTMQMIPNRIENRSGTDCP